MMIDYEATIRNMDLRYAELYADLKEAELNLYKAYDELGRMRANPERCEVENVELRKQLFRFKVGQAVASDELLDKANRRANYAAKMFWMVVQYARGKRSVKTLPKWVQKELGGWFGMDWVTDVTWGEPK